MLLPGSEGGGSLGYWGEQKELCQCVCIGGPGRGPCLGEGVGARGCGSTENAVSPAIGGLMET